MKFVVQVVVTIALSFLLQYFLPWWTVAIAAGLGGYFVNNKNYLSFIAGFAAAGLLWLAMAYAIDLSTDSILTEKINRLLPINSFVLTAFVGALVGGFGALTGSLVRSKK